jgi:hypothetical protein
MQRVWRKDDGDDKHPFREKTMSFSSLINLLAGKGRGDSRAARRVDVGAGEDQPATYYNPLTYSHQTEEQLWASCGNWDL